MTDESRFWSRVDSSGGSETCWTWQGAKNRKGYGRVYWEQRMRPAHQVAWELHNKAAFPASQGCHSCDNPSCVNPRHIWPGNASANLHDCSRKGRHFQKQKQVCANGHPYSGSNLRITRRNGTDERHCRACERMWLVQQRARERNRRTG